MTVPQKCLANPRARHRGQPANAPPAPAPPEHGAARGRPRTHAARVEDAPDEEFDLENISADEEESVPPRARTRVHAPVDPPAIYNDPLLNTVKRTSRAKTPPDIKHFFDREGEDTICNSCQ